MRWERGAWVAGRDSGKDTPEVHEVAPIDHLSYFCSCFIGLMG